MVIVRGIIGGSSVYKINADNLVEVKGIKASDGKALQVDAGIAEFLVSIGICVADQGPIKLAESFKTTEIPKILKEVAESNWFLRSKKSVLEMKEAGKLLSRLLDELIRKDLQTGIGIEGNSSFLYVNVNELENAVRQLDSGLLNIFRSRQRLIQDKCTEQILKTKESHHIKSIAENTKSAIIIVSEQDIKQYHRANEWMKQAQQVETKLNSEIPPDGYPAFIEAMYLYVSQMPPILYPVAENIPIFKPLLSKKPYSSDLTDDKTIQKWVSEATVLLIKANDKMHAMATEAQANFHSTLFKLKELVKEMVDAGESDEYIFSATENIQKQLEKYNKVLKLLGRTRLLFNRESLITEARNNKAKQDYQKRIQETIQKVKELFKKKDSLAKTGTVEQLEKFIDELKVYKNNTALSTELDEPITKIVEDSSIKERFEQLKKKVELGLESAVHKQLEKWLANPEATFTKDRLQNLSQAKDYDKLLEVRRAWLSLPGQPFEDVNDAMPERIEGIVTDWVASRLTVFEKNINSIMTAWENMENTSGEKNAKSFAKHFSTFSREVCSLRAITKEHEALLSLAETLKIEHSVEDDGGLTSKIDVFMDTIVKLKIYERVTEMINEMMNNVDLTNVEEASFSGLSETKMMREMITDANKLFNELGIKKQIEDNIEDTLKNKYHEFQIKKAVENIAKRVESQERILHELIAIKDKQVLSEKLNTLSETANGRQKLRAVFISNGKIINATKGDDQTGLLYQCLTINHLYKPEELQKGALLVDGRETHYEEDSSGCIYYANNQRVFIGTGSRINFLSTAGLAKFSAEELKQRLISLNENVSRDSASKTKLEKIIDLLSSDEKGRKKLREIFLAQEEGVFEVKLPQGHLHKYVNIQHLFSPEEISSFGGLLVNHKDRGYVKVKASDEKLVYNDDNQIYIAEGTKLKIDNTVLVS